MQGEIGSQEPLHLAIADEKLRSVSGHFHSLIEGYQQEINDLRDHINRLEDDLRTVRNLLAAQQELNDIYERRGEACLTSPYATTPVLSTDEVEPTDHLTCSAGNQLDMSPSDWDKWYDQESNQGFYDLPPALGYTEIKEDGLIANTEGVEGAGTIGWVQQTASRKKASS